MKSHAAAKQATAKKATKKFLQGRPRGPEDARDFVVFENALYNGMPITHATIDGKTTMCGRSGWETSEGWSDIGPDCLRCASALAKRKDD